MSGRKNNLKKYAIISGASMGANVTSAVTNIEHLDNIGIQFNFSGTPTGTFQVQVSADYAQDMNGNVQNAGNWVPLALPSNPVASGSAGVVYIDMTQLSAPWIRAVYTKTSGTGTLDAFIVGKMI